MVVGITDDADGVLRDHELLLLVANVTAHLAAEEHVLVHCAAGRSRSGYVTAAIVARLSGRSIVESLEWIRQRYPDANPNEWFLAHLKQMEPKLRLG